MAKRKRLRSVAEGLLGTFVSRNNDIDGYWGLGKLYGHALQDAGELEIDLLSQRTCPESDAFRDLAQRYYDLLVDRCRARNLPMPLITKATIHIKFNVDEECHPVAARQSRGEPFRCSVEIVDDLQRCHRAQTYGRVSPHDPGRELRSRRYIGKEEFTPRPFP